MRFRRNANVFVAMAMFLLAGSATAQQVTTEINRIEADRLNVVFGKAIATIGDLNGDGIPEILIGSTAGDEFQGAALVVSGADGALLASHRGPRVTGLYGASVCGLGDFNRDGIDEYAVGVPDGSGRGQLHVYSGKTQKLLYLLEGEAVGDEFGISIARLDDQDSDGIEDYMVGGSERDRAPRGGFSGYVRIVSGQLGGTLSTIRGQFPGGCFGIALAPTGDVNGDGYTDIVIAAPCARDQAVHVYAGSGSGVFSRLYSLAEPGVSFGAVVTGVGDLDGDGLPDIAVGDPYGVDADSGEQLGQVWLYKGNDGSSLGRLVGPNRTSFFGTAIVPLGDLDGDRRGDFLVTAPSADDGTTLNVGLVQMISGKSKRAVLEHRGAEFDLGIGAALDVGDFNGDGVLDFVAAEYTHSQTVRVFSWVPVIEATVVNDFSRRCGNGPNLTGDMSSIALSGGTLGVAINGARPDEFVHVFAGLVIEPFQLSPTCTLAFNPQQSPPIFLGSIRVDAVGSGELRIPLGFSTIHAGISFVVQAANDGGISGAAHFTAGF